MSSTRWKPITRGCSTAAFSLRDLDRDVDRLQAVAGAGAGELRPVPYEFFLYYDV
jgi:hypothetical protein